MSKKSKISLSRLETFLKAECDRLRTSMDASEYKNYLIALLFLKRINDQFDIDRKKLEDELKKEFPDANAEDIENELDVPEKYNCYVPKLARWKFLLAPVNEQDEEISYGDAITTALKEVEISNAALLSGVLSKTKFNELNTKGERILDEETLRDLLKDFNDFPALKDENFEFPDLLGAAYEYLIKFFAESAGKKAGEFYTPSEVVYLMGQILQPKETDEICDPTVGSGGLLITMHNYVENRYGSAKKLTLHGQEKFDSPYQMCKMNMIFHNITNARIEQGDTLIEPKLVTGGALNQYDIVVANPPFSQNYTTAKMQFQERFQNWTSKKKQADFMFVQHMISVLKNNGRMAVVMPHGVLFRGGEEQKVRERLITGSTTNPSCILECVIGLPQGLFYGTGIPASLLIINKKGAADRKGVFFINADREYKEGKNQNSLRPEDIEKISYVYHNKLEIAGYSRLVTKEELKAEDYNCNIRRYVDNSGAPTPQNVIAHINGGIPQDEIDSLKSQTDCYDGLKDELFTKPKDGFADFTSKVSEKSEIKNIVSNSYGKRQVLDNYANAIDPEEWDAEQYEVMPKTVISDIKNEIKELKAKRKELAKHQKALEKQGKMGVNVADELQKCNKDVADIDVQISDKEQGIAHHIALENELKECKKQIREIEKSKEALADKAREQISDDDARTLITARWLKTLHDTILQYLEAHARALQQCVELLYDKYSVTLGMLVSERQQATDELDGYLRELGYKL